MFGKGNHSKGKLSQSNSAGKTRPSEKNFSAQIIHLQN